MDGDIGALILLIVLIVSAFLLIVLKLAQFVNHFSREKQYLLTEMSRAADYNEYRYWRRELRCLYLCLIPFVTERNVMKIYRIFFHKEYEPLYGRKAFLKKNWHWKLALRKKLLQDIFPASESLNRK